MGEDPTCKLDLEMFEQSKFCCTIDDSTIAVSFHKSDKIGLFSYSGGSVERKGEIDDSMITGPFGMAVASDGNLIISVDDNKMHGLCIYDMKAKKVTHTVGGDPGYGIGQFKRPRGLCFDAEDGVCYVADSGNNRVQILKYPGLKNMIDSQSKKPMYITGKMVCPQGVAVDGKYLLVAGIQGLTAFKRTGRKFSFDHMAGHHSSQNYVSIYDGANSQKKAVTTSLFTQALNYFVLNKDGKWYKDDSQDLYLNHGDGPYGCCYIDGHVVTVCEDRFPELRVYEAM